MKSGSPFPHLAQRASWALLAVVLGGMAAAFADGPPAGTYTLEHGPLLVSVEYAHERNGRVPVLVYTDVLAATLWMTPDGAVWDGHSLGRPWGKPLFRIDWGNDRLAVPGGVISAAGGKKSEAQAIPFRRAGQNNHRARLVLPGEFRRSTLEISDDRRLGWWKPFGEGGPGLFVLVMPVDEKLFGSDGKSSDQAAFRLYSHGVSGRGPFSVAPANTLRPHCPARQERPAWQPTAEPITRAAVTIPAAERAALIALYNSTLGESWTNRTGWKTEPLDADGFAMPGTEGSWYGVTVGNGGASVTGLNFYNNNLQGELPPEIANLQALKSIRTIANFSLGGAVPPELGNLALLEELDLSMCALSGPIPANLGNLANLRTLNLLANDLEGPIPPELGELGKLQSLQLDQNQLSGTIPSSLGGLANLQVFRAAANMLVGPLPAELGDLVNLNEFDVFMNQLDGGIPASYGSLASLSTLGLGANCLSGPIPGELGSLKDLLILDLRSNVIGGAIPAGLGGMARVFGLLMDDNQLSGPIPPEMGNMSRLAQVHLGHNQLSGSVPPTFGQLAQISVLSLENNQLEGNLPDSLGDLQQMVFFWLGENRFDGPLPPSLGNLVKMYALELGGNRLSGTIPGALGTLPELSTLDLSDNRFSGGIPVELTGLPKLLTLDIAGNALAGEIPPSVTDLDGLGYARISYNGLHTADPAVQAFMAQEFGAGWADTQTVPPEGLQAKNTGPGGVRLGWTPVSFQEDTAAVGRRSAGEEESESGYEVWGAAASEGPYRLLSVTESKSQTEVLEALRGSGASWFKLRTVTAPHPWNQNTVYSDFSAPLAVTPAGPAAGDVAVYADGAKTGPVLRNSLSQVLPASALTLRIAPSAFAGASAGHPLGIRVKLPGRARLSQTLATGDGFTAAPVAAAGEKLVDLAVAEYRLSNGKPTPVNGSALAGIGPQAVQLLRYVAGEDAFWLRLTENTASWAPQNGGEFLGVTVGLGGGAWPSTAATNWGAAGIGRQASTLLCADLLRYDFATGGGDAFPLTVVSEDLSTGDPGTATFGSDPFYAVFTKGTEAEGASATAALGGAIADTAGADVNRDGVDDLVAVVAGEKRVYWCPGLAGGGYGGMNVESLDPAAGEPALVEVADAYGDALPDLLIGEKGGTLRVYPWSNIFGFFEHKEAAAAPLARKLQSAGDPTASLAIDVNGDGKKDWVGLSTAGNSLEVRFGEAFTASATYVTPPGPVGLASGDFDGDGAPDLAVACASAGSVAVFRNDGTGAFTRGDIDGLGDGPSALAAGDLDRNGKDDLVVTIRNSKEVTVLLATGGHAFDVAGRQRLELPNRPDSVVLADLDGKLGPDATVGYADDFRLTQLYADLAGHLGGARTVTDMVGSILTGLDGALLNTGVTGLRPENSGRSAGGVYAGDGLVQALAAESWAMCWPRSAGVSFAAVNLGEQAATAAFELCADGTREPLATSEAPLEPGRQLFGYFQDTNLLGPEAAGPHRWARTRLDAAGVAGFFMQPAPSGPDLDGVMASGPGSGLTEMAFPEVRTGAGYTVLTLVNPGFEQAAARILLHGADGGLKGQAGRLIAPGDRLKLDVASLFPDAADSDWVRVRSDRELLGTEAFGTHGGNVAVLAALPAGQASGVLYDPHVASGDFGTAVYFSDITLVNTGEAQAQVEVKRLDDDNNELNRKTVTVPARGKYHSEAKELFGLTGTVEGWLQADPAGAVGVAGCMTFGEAGASSKMLSSLPLQTLGHRKFLLPWMVSGTFGGTTYFTGVAILEPDRTVPTRVKLTVYGPDGAALTSRSYSLKPYDPTDCPDCRKRQVFLLSQGLAELPDLLGGYLVLEAETITRGLLVFQLFGDFGNTVLTAVPSIPLD